MKAPLASNSGHTGSFIRQSLLLENINVNNYIKYGFTVCFYITNFTYNNNMETSAIDPHVLSIFFDNGIDEYIRHKHKIVDDQYVFKSNIITKWHINKFTI
jgi:hypothetical protein